MGRAQRGAWLAAWLLAGLTGAVAGAVASGADTPPPTTLTRLNPPRPLPDFALTDQHGAPMGKAGLLGRPSVLFFGFTHCPDVCPTTLSRLVAVYRSLPPAQRARLRLVFVSVDPMRDTPSRLATYLHGFTAPIMGLTGPLGALTPLLTGLGVAYAYTAQPAAGAHAQHAGHGAPAYTVTHSGALYLVDAQGRLAGVYTNSDDSVALRAGLAAFSAP